MAQIPRDPLPDSTLALLREGYTFIPKRCQRFRSDLFETRLMMRKAICMSGEAAAREFYAPERFTRQGAMPPTTVRLLQDRGSVQLLDGADHHHRKRMFMSLMTPENIERLSDTFAEHWLLRAPNWERQGSVVLYDALNETLTAAVCDWAGIVLTQEDTTDRTDEFVAMIEGAGAVGPRNWKGALLRARCERWARNLIERVRENENFAPEGSATRVIAKHRDRNGALLSVNDAAVELLNILRPTVAVGRFIVFAALALHEYPEWRDRLRAGDDGDLERFVQEVRRFYPFFPFVGGIVREPFDWGGHHFAKGDWVILDLYGTNHDERVWEHPDTFNPDRFRTWDGSAYNFIPQGGGDYANGHRCPGEWITIALLKRAVSLLTTAMTYDVPDQDLSIHLNVMPALPKSGFVIRNIRPA